MQINAQRDLLVIGDVHLHENTPESTVQDLTHLFSRFTNGGIPHDRPHRAVLAGDFFDFPMMKFVPGPSDAPFPVSKRETRFGLDATGDKAAWKLEQLAEKHGLLFSAMARFVACGNEMVFVPGNHDEEILFSEVQECLRRLLGDDGTKEAEGREDNGQRHAVRFTPWFYHEPGFIFVEHGHFYDSDNVPQEKLRPCPLTNGSGIEPSMGSLVTRYLLTILDGYDSRGDSDKTPWPLLVKVLRSMGIRAPITIYRYYAMAAKVLKMTRDRKKKPWQEPLVNDGKARDLGVTGSQLRRLLSFTATPTTDSLRRVMGRLYLDRSAAFAAFVITLLLLVPNLGSGRTWGMGLPVLSLGVLLFTMRNGNLFGNRNDVACRKAAEGIRDVLDTPCVVMGHAHRAERVESKAQDGTKWTFLNTGSFDDPQGTESMGRPYLLIRREGDNRVHGDLLFEKSSADAI